MCVSATLQITIGDMFPRGLDEVLKSWVEVEYLTFHAWRGFCTRHSTDRQGVPTTWQKLKEITVYSALEKCREGDILRTPDFYPVIPDPFLFMPDPKHFERLTSFTIMVPNDSQINWERYERYSALLSDNEKALINLVKGVAKGKEAV
jgi:hypothetical protein